MKKPYVVSADIALLLKEWAIQKGFVIPSQEFFSELRKKFCDICRKIFPNFEFVSEAELVSGLAHLANQSGLPIISLDHVYFTGEYSLEITRLVSAFGNDRGLGCRFGSLPLLQQMRMLRASGVREAVIVDDVLFSGVLLERMLAVLSRMSIRVPSIYVGVGIAEGVERLGNFGCEVQCVRFYSGVVDEVCERDFYPGTPFSGRTLDRNRVTGLPYIFPFGNPEQWALIPARHAKEFSAFCLRQTITLFDEIERCSNRAVFCKDLNRGVLGLPTGNVQYTKALRGLL